MRFATSIEIEAPQQRAWDVLTDLRAWPDRLETVDSIEVLTPGPIAPGTRVRLRQPKLSEGTWDVTTWDAPSYFAWMQKASGATTVAGHRVEAMGERRTRLTLTLEMHGLLVPLMGQFYKGLINRYLQLEAEGLKRAAESASTDRAASA